MWQYIVGGAVALVTGNYLRNKLNSRPRVGDVATVNGANLIPNSTVPASSLPQVPVQATITAVRSLSSGTPAIPIRGIDATVNGIPVSFARGSITSMTRAGVAVSNPAG